ncbi:MAG TPA: CopD family protein [Kofleriaceae bacterium]|nr:CopD family protein [Kofleriaceae bacterium]
MSPSIYQWLVTGHLIGVILWMGSLFAVYWLLRLHAQAPKDALEKLTLMERSLALTMDLAAALAIGTGLVMALSKGGTHPTSNLFAAPGAGWFHAKLTVVVLGILSVHGIVRGRVAKFSRGEKPPVPQWLWSLLLVAIVAVVVLVIRGPQLFAHAAT